MADFPSKVSTETSSPHSQASFQGGSSFRGAAANVTGMMDMSFLRSIVAILMIIEIVLGLIHWALVASTPYVHAPAYGWVMFVAVTLWLLTIGLFCVSLFGLNRMLSVPWALVVMMYNGVAAVLYLTAFLTNAATVHLGLFFESYLGAAAFFGAVVTLAYGISAVFSYLEWKRDRGNVGSTVPA